jgi:hypothetical protein
MGRPAGAKNKHKSYGPELISETAKNNLLSLEQLRRLSEKEFDIYYHNLSQENQNIIRTMVNQAIIDHFRKPDHSYENSGFNMTKFEYSYLERIYGRELLNNNIISFIK